MSVEFQDYYQTLGVSRDATDQEIQKAFRGLARKYHPDINKEAGAEDKSKEINEAYEVLGDSEKRKRYDTLGANWKAGEQFQPPPGWENLFSGFAANGAGFSSGQMGSGFSDFFDMLFGGAGSAGMGGGMGPMGFDASSMFSGPRQTGRNGETIEATLECSIEELINPVKRRISFQVREVDPQGRAELKQKSYEVAIPKGVSDGGCIRLAGQGGKGAGGGKDGDLLLRIKLRKHPRYRVDGHNLILPVPIAPWEAALGASVAVKTPTGEISLKVPSGSQSGQRLRVKGKGLPKSEKTNGDLFVELKIVVPKELTEKEKELFSELAKESPFHAREDS